MGLFVILAELNKQTMYTLPYNLHLYHLDHWENKLEVLTQGYRADRNMVSDFPLKTCRGGSLIWPQTILFSKPISVKWLSYSTDGISSNVAAWKTDQRGNRDKYSQEAASIQKATVGHVDGSACMRLLVVIVLDRTAVASLSGEKREWSVTAPALVPSEGGEGWRHRSTKPVATKMTTRVQFTRAGTANVKHSDDFLALGKHRKCVYVHMSDDL